MLLRRVNLAGHLGPSNSKLIKLGVNKIPIWFIGYHGGIINLLKIIKKGAPDKNIVVFNFDAHTDNERGKSLNGSWVYEAVERQKIVSRVFHMETFWKAGKDICEKWQNPEDFHQIKGYLKKNNPLGVISIDFDYFSLSDEVLEERKWEDIYHRSPGEVQLMIEEIIKFIKKIKINVASIVLAESKRCLSTKADGAYINMLIKECKKLAKN